MPAQLAVTPDGRVSDTSSTSATRLYFDSAPFTSVGTFTSTSVSGTDPRFPSISLNLRGSWGGRFSTIDDRSENPRILAKMHVGVATTPGDIEVEFIGAHVGATSDF